MKSDDSVVVIVYNGSVARGSGKHEAGNRVRENAGLYASYLPSCQSIKYTISYMHMTIVMILFDRHLGRLDYELLQVPLAGASTADHVESL